MKHNVVKKLGVGSAGDAFLLEDGKAIIVGKREDSFGTYQAMFDKMCVLDGKITAVKYPKFYELIAPCDDYPFGAVIEEYIDGAELRDKVSNLSESQKREIGKTLAKFITEVHDIDAEGNKEEEIEINLAKFDRSLGILKEYLTDDVYAELVNIKTPYEKLMLSKNFCATHGDLNAGNIMIGEDGKVSGIIDFGNMEYYIPEIEFVHMYFFDKTIYNAMVQNYPKPIKDTEIVLLELVVNIRHFKNIKNFEDRRTKCLKNIQKLLNEYLNMQSIEKNSIKEQ